MNVARNFQELRAEMSPTAKAASAAEHQRLVAEYAKVRNKETDERRNRSSQTRSHPERVCAAIRAGNRNAVR
jgi:hypothetical protein